MRYTKSIWLVFTLVLSLVLSACNLGQESEPTPDVGAIFTSAAETVSAQFSLDLTQTAQAVPTATQPPTATLVPTFAIGGSPTATGTTPVATLGTSTALFDPLATATPLGVVPTQSGPLCMDSAFIADVNIPDGSVVEKNSQIAKVWRIQNTGICTWDDGFSLQPVTGDATGEWLIDEVKEFVAPGETVDIRIELTTPSPRAEWGGCWKMQGDNDYYFGTFLCLLVKVE